MQQLVSKLESIVTKMSTETQSRNDADKAAIDQMKSSSNQAQPQMMQTVQAEAGQWEMWRSYNIVDSGLLG